MIPRAHRVLAALLAYVLFASLATPAIAKEIEVTLKNGATYEGKLVERVPGDHVTIKLATGEIKRFEWDELEVEPTLAPPPKTNTAPSTEDEGYWVSIKTDQRGVVLERAIGRSTLGDAEVTHWERVCQAPCDIRVRAGSDYRLGGSGLRETDTFTIDRDTRIEARLGDKTAWALGALSIGLSLPLALAGALVSPARGEGRASFDRTQTTTSESSSDLRAPLLVSSLLLATIGVVLVAANGTSVKFDAHAFSRRPEWRVGEIRFSSEGLMF